MKGVRTKIALAPFKAWFAFGEKIIGEWSSFTLTSSSWVAYTAIDETKRKVICISYLKKSRHSSVNDIWEDPLQGIPKAAFFVDISDEPMDGAVVYVSDDLRLWRKAAE